MKLKARAQVTLGGVLFILMGLAYYQRHGALPYLNWLRQPVFPMGAVVTGMVVCVLAWLPQKWVGRWTRSREEREGHVLQHLDEHRHRHADRHRPST